MLIGEWSRAELQLALRHWADASRHDAIPRGGNPYAWMSQTTHERAYADWTERDMLIDRSIADLKRRGQGYYAYVIELAYLSNLLRSEQAKKAKKATQAYCDAVHQAERFLLDVINGYSMAVDKQKRKVLNMW